MIERTCRFHPENGPVLVFTVIVGPRGPWDVQEKREEEMLNCLPCLLGGKHD